MGMHTDISTATPTRPPHSGASERASHIGAAERSLLASQSTPSWLRAAQARSGR